jgi:imidazole glycerol-phosphate synthase subunit HisH
MINSLHIAIIDYEMGNLFSVQRACEHVGLKSQITSDISAIMNSDAIILPGVGAFGDAMKNLGKLDLISPIKDFIETGKPFMGVCLGMQLAFSESEEFGVYKGLDIIKGSVVRFPRTNNKKNKIKVPQVGWNRICKPAGATQNFWDASPLKDMSDGEFMYFVHSYYPVPSEKKVVLSDTTYEGTNFCSSVLRENVFACQFHPEKSANEGIKIYSNWAEIIHFKNRKKKV